MTDLAVDGTVINKVSSGTQNVIGITITGGTTGVVQFGSFSFYFTLQRIHNFSSYEYDQIKLKSYSLSFKPLSNETVRDPGSSEAGCPIPILHSCVDHDDATRPTADYANMQSLVTFPNYKKKLLNGTTSWGRKVYPKLKGVGLSSAGAVVNGPLSRGDRWIDKTDSGTISWNGIKGVIEALQVNAVLTFRWYYQVSVRCTFCCKLNVT